MVLNRITHFLSFRNIFNIDILFIFINNNIVILFYFALELLKFHLNLLLKNRGRGARVYLSFATNF